MGSAWGSLSVARSSKPTVGSCGRRTTPIVARRFTSQCRWRQRRGRREERNNGIVETWNHGRVAGLNWNNGIMEEWKPIEETIEKFSGAILIIIPPFHNS